jgi:hypothetical protein
MSVRRVALAVALQGEREPRARHGIGGSPHRGQISTYLRPMGSTVPHICVHSADEP